MTQPAMLIPSMMPGYTRIVYDSTSLKCFNLQHTSPFPRALLFCRKIPAPGFSFCSHLLSLDEDFFFQNEDVQDVLETLGLDSPVSEHIDQ